MDTRHKARALMGRILATGLAAATLLGGVGMANAATFTDVTERTPHHDDIMWLAGRDITTGYGDGTFRGMNAIARQDMAAFLYRMAGSPTFDADKALDAHQFTDVTRDTPHWKAILWTESTGITKGYEDGTFGGMRTVVRQDMAAMLHRYTDWAGITPAQEGTLRFTDIDHVAHRADVEWFGTTGIAQGFTDGTFGGMRQVVRQDMAAFLHRLAATKPTQDQLDAAKKAVSDAQARVDEAKKTADTTKADADNAQAQWDQGSLGFFQTYGYDDGVKVLTYKANNWDKYTVGLGKADSATSLTAMQCAVETMRRTEQHRSEENANLPELKVSMFMLGLDQREADHNYYDLHGNLTHTIGNGNLAMGYSCSDASDAWYGEKKAWEAAVAKDTTLAQYDVHDLQDQIAIQQHDPALWYEVGHFMTMVCRDWRLTSAAKGGTVTSQSFDYANHMNTDWVGDDWLVDQSEIHTMSLDDYANQLTAYIDGLTKRINAHKDAQQALDKANDALTQAQAKLDALTAMTA